VIALSKFGLAYAAMRVFACRKSDGNYFPCNPKDVCHEWDGDPNPLLVQNDLLGELRKIFEPYWNSSIATLLSKTLSPRDMFAVAGYFAGLMVCTPTWRRVGVTMYDDHAKSFLIFSKKMQAKHGRNEWHVQCVSSAARGGAAISGNAAVVARE
jgi:hypothetical protein